MAKLYDISLDIMDADDIMDTYEEEAVRADELGDAMETLLEKAREEYNLTDFGFKYTFN